ncbi:hypothetical protein NDU88_003587 [Pleurodeles waltl]|uniref:Uncharacterized protein n=1 Tax=Pleurodeles waltl TaxID=8319 RepID=A0AAV7SGE0_PLEWA|nr:hypothetical protein NDU88_003587 [Pleurodeles waltl]
MDRTISADRSGGDLPDLTQSKVQDTLDKILGAIEDTRATLQHDINQVAVEVGLLLADHQKLEDRVKEAEVIIADLTPRQKDLAFSLIILVYFLRDDFNHPGRVETNSSEPHLPQPSAGVGS